MAFWERLKLFLRTRKKSEQLPPATSGSDTATDIPNSHTQIRKNRSSPKTPAAGKARLPRNPSAGSSQRQNGHPVRPASSVRSPHSDRKAPGNGVTTNEEGRNPITRLESTHHLPNAVDQQRTLSEIVICKLIVVYKDNSFEHFEDVKVRWLDKSQYRIINNTATRLLRDRGNIPESQQLYRKSGRCRLINRE